MKCSTCSLVVLSSRASIFCAGDYARTFRHRSSMQLLTVVYQPLAELKKEGGVLWSS
ncbi:hypothetical protein MJ579_26225 [Klebsiella pneumoniae]|nr:hypothetical protein MJ579_26225 [Klebsiella pneumoniae]